MIPTQEMFATAFKPLADSMVELGSDCYKVRINDGAIVAVLAKAEKARVLDYCMSAVDAFTDGDLGKARELLEKIISVDGDGAKLPALVSDSDDDEDDG